jgi:hypothetical protein
MENSFDHTGALKTDEGKSMPLQFGHQSPFTIPMIQIQFLIDPIVQFNGGELIFKYLLFGPIRYGDTYYYIRYDLGLSNCSSVLLFKITKCYDVEN